MPDVVTATGAKVYIAPSQTTAPANAAAYAALTWTEITLVRSIGPYGDEASIINAPVLGDARVRKAKGSRDAGNSELVVYPLATDAGQSALIAAEATNFDYPIKVELPTKLAAAGTNGIDYFMAKVGSKRRTVGENDNVITDTFSLPVVSAITSVAPTAS